MNIHKKVREDNQKKYIEQSLVSRMLWDGRVKTKDLGEWFVNKEDKPNHKKISTRKIGNMILKRV